MPTHLTVPDAAPEFQRPQDNPQLAIGTEVGAYVIEEGIGSGSMGQVYRAKHRRLGRQVALKVLRDSLLGDQSLIERFLQEGRAVNQINHEHIVEVHDYVEEREPARVYCVMEFLQGQTLAQRLEQRPSTVDSARRIARQIAHALTASHSAGVVHRDLKPENIFLLTRDGRDDFVKVLDFGVAKCVQPVGISLVQTAQGAVLGTPRYMAPEQVAGMEVDARTDIYALGTILYELISGAPPFEAPSFGQLAAQIINDTPAPLPALTVGGEPVPAELAALVMACLAKRSKDRPATMADVEAALVVAPLQLTKVHRSHFRKFAMVAVALLLTLMAGLWPSPTPAIQQVAETVAVAAPQATALVVVAEQVTLRVESQPPGALVTRADTGAVLGRTPLELTLDRAELEMKLRIELDGHLPLEREVSLDRSERLELTLQARSTGTRRPAARAVTDGLMDPF